MLPKETPNRGAGRSRRRPDPFDTGILLPRSQVVERTEETVAPAAQRHGTRTGGNRSCQKTTRSTPALRSRLCLRPTPQDVAAPPDAEAETLPADALDDDAAARIAAEANATAAALENLKRLLMHRLPEPHIARRIKPAGSRTRAYEPPPIPAYRPPSSCRLRRRQ